MPGLRGLGAFRRLVGRRDGAGQEFAFLATPEGAEDEIQLLPQRRQRPRL